MMRISGTDELIRELNALVGSVERMELTCWVDCDNLIHGSVKANERREKSGPGGAMTDEEEGKREKEEEEEDDNEDGGVSAVRL